ncbi:hypothetical protein SUGI_0147860 [Cryptomeria japonica]|nr:hypothetical protein SUGI_0147860 [Cryptomeria japonica]
MLRQIPLPKSFYLVNARDKPECLTGREGQVVLCGWGGSHPLLLSPGLPTCQYHFDLQFLSFPHSKPLCLSLRSCPLSFWFSSGSNSVAGFVNNGKNLRSEKIPMASGNSWADQWDSHNDDYNNSNGPKEKDNAKMAKVKGAASVGFEKAKVAASSGAQKITALQNLQI